MVVEVRLVSWCDVCQDAGDQNPAESYTLDVVGAPRVIELCETHHKELVSPLEVALAALGRAPGNETGAVRKGRLRADDTRPRNWECRMPDCTKAYTNKGNLQTHTRATHGLSWGDYLVQTEQRKRTPKNKIPAEFKCDYPGCGEVIDPALYSSPLTVLGLHKRREHSATDS